MSLLQVLRRSSRGATPISRAFRARVYFSRNNGEESENLRDNFVLGGDVVHGGSGKVPVELFSRNMPMHVAAVSYDVHTRTSTSRALQQQRKSLRVGMCCIALVYRLFPV